VYQLTGQPISTWHAQHHFAGREFNACVLGLSLPRPQIYERINARCHAMVGAGLVDEVHRLYGDGFAPTLPALRSPGYREIGDYVRGRCDLPAAVAAMAQATRQLAKRQLTWFRADKQITWCAPDLGELRRHASALWHSEA